MATQTDPETLAGAEADQPAGHKPYVPDHVRMPEFTWSAVILGTLLGLIFSASSIYLVLKVGMTVSASIPVAVLAITVFRFFSRITGLRQATILENNIVQTAGSAGESIAFGVGVTMPALLILGFQMDPYRVMVVSVLGGLLGILAMIPLRRAFIVKMHGKPGEPGTLLYPEGTACAQVLISGEKGGTTGQTVFIGFFIAFLHKFATEGMGLLVSAFRLPLRFINKSAVFAGEMASELLGVGYIIGLRTSAIMMAGAVLGYLVLIPLIAFSGLGSDQPVPPGKKPISEMSLTELRNDYLLYIGAGCVAAAGLISMGRTLPLLARSISAGLRGVRAGAGNGAAGAVRRTEDDMSMRVVILGSVALVLLLALFLVTQVNIVAAVAGALLVVVFGFLFVTVSARLTGEIGSSSNPISGMTVATLTVTCLIFWGLGWTSSIERVLALSIAAVVCVAASNGGTTAQSLKTGFLVGGTPRAMQYAILVGALISSLVIGLTLLGFNAAGTVRSSRPENLPSLALSAAELKEITEREDYQGQQYVVWDQRRNYGREHPSLPFDAVKGDDARIKALGEVRPARYLVEPDTGRVAWLVDDAIMGKLKETDEGRAVQRDFDAPKTQVMGIIINGVLSGKLKWDLILIGALIAVMLELCGVSALAFAVGVYVPIQFSTPIFLGGLVRWGVDRYVAKREQSKIEAVGDDPEARARAEVEAIRKSETSPGVLLAAGYIAGGSLAGMLIAFTNFSDTLVSSLTTMQYRRHTVTQAQPLTGVAADVSANEEELADLNAATLARLGPVPAGTRIVPSGKDLPWLSGALGASADLATAPVLIRKNVVVVSEPTTLGELAERQGLGSPDKALDLLKVNKMVLARSVPVKQFSIVRMPDFSEVVVRRDTTLGELAWEQMDDADRAVELFERNREALKLELPKEAGGVARLGPATTVPEGTTLKLPQKEWPALAWFGLLVVFMAAVGTGHLLRSPEETNGNGNSA